ncbi:methyl-accepting chemotaxis protein [Cellvibrio sp. ARAG 10.3]|uniref:methyl-accepting chemotaxis protein n=1 Tax=Cellvibrio sp. ARAG 10.3 TaxID=3451358 RepID=UPI003F46AE18
MRFYGVVDILGNPYVTGYEPILDSAGDVIGIWYVGYKADLTELSTAIAAGRVLEEGFVVLRDNTGKTRIHSDNLSLEAVDNILANPGDNWTLNSEVFTPWGYEIITAYSNNEISTMVRQVSLMLGLLIVIVGVVALVIVYVLIQSVVIRPLKQTTARLQDIVSGEGDLTLRFHSRSQDELGQLANGFDLLMDRLQGTIRSVAQSTQQLTSSAAQLKSIALHTSDTITHQTRDIDAIAAAIHEMSATAHEVARNAASVAMATAKADSEAQQGHKILNSTIQATEALAGKIETASRVISALADASNEIGAVLNVIRSIAEQTNLLALNAAIEAARAGEQGRGFAVVADEVRSLASRTQDSTEEVDRMVKRFQDNSLKAFEQMRLAEETVRANVTTAQESGNSIKTVLLTVSELNNLNTEISHSVDQQSQVAEDINRNITRINNTGDQSQERAAETLRASEGLSKLSEEIQRQLAAYRV